MWNIALLPQNALAYVVVPWKRRDLGNLTSLTAYANLRTVKVERWNVVAMYRFALVMNGYRYKDSKIYPDASILEPGSLSFLCRGNPVQRYWIT